METSRLDIIWIHGVGVFYIILNHAKIRRRNNFVSYNDEAIMVNVDKVNNGIRFDILEKAVKIGNMFIWGLHDFVDVITSHGVMN